MSCPSTPGHVSPRSPDCKGKVLSGGLSHFVPLILSRESIITLMPAYQCLPICFGRISRQAGNKVFMFLRTHPGCIWRVRLWEAMQMFLALNVTLSKFTDKSNLVPYAWYMRTPSIWNKNILWIKTLFKINKRSGWFIYMKNENLRKTKTLLMKYRGIGNKIAARRCSAL